MLKISHIFNLILTTIIIAASASSSAFTSICDDLLTPHVQISSEQNASWLPYPNRTQWILSDKIPEGASVTGAYVLASHDGKFLMGRHRQRGWDIPGGHVEPGERPDISAAREALEETGSKIVNLRLIAYQKIELLGPKPENYSYPYPESYQALYVGEVAELGEFKEEEDMVERELFTFEDALRDVPWASRNLALFESAIILSRVLDAPKTVVYSGSFDPVHEGHAEALRAAMKKSGARFAVVTGNNPNRSKPSRLALEFRTQMLRMQYQGDTEVFATSLPISTLTQLLKNRTRRVGILGSDQFFRHKTTEKEPKLDVDEWILIPREGTPPLPDVTQFFGKPATVVDSGELKKQRHSSTKVRQYLAQNAELYSNQTLVDNEALPIHPEVLQFIARNRLYHPETLISKISSDILGRFKDLKTVELKNLNDSVQSGLSGDLVFMLMDDTGKKKAVIKAFITEERDGRFANELKNIRSLGQLSVLFTEKRDEYNLLVMSVAPGIEMRLALLEHKEEAGQVAYRIGQELAKLHSKNATTALPDEANPKIAHLLKKTRQYLLKLGMIDSFEALKRQLLDSPLELGTVHRDANPGNFFFDPVSNEVTMIDVGRLNDAGFVDYEYFQFISSIHRLKEMNDLDDASIEAAIQSFKSGYRSIRNRDQNRFFEEYWRLRTRASGV